MLERRTKTKCMICKAVIQPDMFTCGEDACEMAALEGQVMLAPMILNQEVRVARLRFTASLPFPNLDFC